jgi:nucleotidyltransferase AbiEii toxin of type IV toxin-antitoxin system
MRTLARECFDRKWIREQSRSNHLGDIVLEKCLHAFELLGRLVEERLDFVFKGGTSLLLRLNHLRRISIDIDIVCNESPEKLERVLNNCITSPFTKVEEDRRRHNRPPKRRHWNFHYTSFNPKNCPEPYVILDVLEEDNLYPDVEPILIEVPFLIPDHAIRVHVPSIDNLLGDKLTTLAPETIGQQYNEDHPEKIAKHLFDIGELFNVATSFASIRETYLRLYEAENGYRGGSFSMDDCLNDTINVSRLISALAVNARLSDKAVPILRAGIQNLSGHLIRTRFDQTSAAVAAGKAALLATIIKFHVSGITWAQLRFDAKRVEELRGEQLPLFPELNKLSGASPEAFHYWLLVQRFARGEA